MANSNRGFAAMDPQKQRKIASEGGKKSRGGAAGRTAAAKRGGENSHRNQ